MDSGEPTYSNWTTFSGPLYSDNGTLSFECTWNRSEPSDGEVEAALVFDGVPLYSTFQTRTPSRTDRSLLFVFSAEHINSQFGKSVS